MKNKSETIGGNPVGFKGIAVGYIMNIVHSRLYGRTVKQILNLLPKGKELSVLDLGCGGGQTIKLFCKQIDNCTICGVDHSREMIDLSKRVNRKYIKQNRAQLVQCDVANMPFQSLQYDICCAFDTINLWQDLDSSIKEVARVLKDNGLFLIINGYPKEESKWWDVVRFKSDKEYASFLETNEFKVEKSEVTKNTIVIVSKKKGPKHEL